MMTQEEIEQQKDIQYYSAIVTAWFNTSLEHDKSLLTLSAGGIGLLLTLLTTVGLSSAESLILYVVAIISFVVTILAILAVFRNNRTHIEDIISKGIRNDQRLSLLDSIAMWAFGFGVFFTAIIGITTAVHSYPTKKEKCMAFAQDSFNGAKNLHVGNESFNGAAKIQPQPVAVSNSQPQTAVSTTGATVNSPAPPPPNSSQTQSK